MRRTSFFTVNDVYVREHSFSGYWAQQIFFTDWLRFEGGLRGDFFVFDVNNRLPRQGRDPNFSAVFLNGRTSDGHREPEGQPDHHPASRTPTSTSTSARAFTRTTRAPTSPAQFSGASERRAPASTTAAQATPLAKATGYELGARTRQFDRLDLAAAIWNLDLESELVFSGDAGTDEPSGPASRRYGIDFEARWQINDWLYADYDLSWVHARFDNGGFVPLAPPILMNGGLTADFHNGFTVALRGRYLDRPAGRRGRRAARPRATTCSTSSRSTAGATSSSASSS